ncbi:MAG TPA: ABC transporter permease [Candidatus Limnocylindrales bacterium]|nr:ABC transporter permease [Candidatus Limnocylindrales bacterium]
MLRSVFAKVVHDQWRMVLGWAAFSAVWPAMYVGLYPSIGALGELEKMLDQFPPAIREFFASASLDLSSPEGFLNMELFTFVAPLLVLAYTVVVCGGATAGEEEKGTMDLLLANPIPRWRIVVEKSAAFVIGTIVIGVGMWIGAAAGAAIADVDLDLVLVGQAIGSVVLLGLALGGFALALGAITGRRWLAAGTALMVVIAGFFLNGFGALVDWLEPWRPISPFYQYIANDPLSNGLDAGNVLVLLAWALIGGIVAVIAFERRDLAR